MIDSTYVRGEFVEGVLVASIRAEKLGDYESQIVSGEIKGALAKSKPRLVIDMAQVVVMSSAGIGMLLDLFRAVQGAGGKIAMCALDEDVLGSLRVTKMDRLFNIRADRAAAMSAVV